MDKDSIFEEDRPFSKTDKSNGARLHRLEVEVVRLTDRIKQLEKSNGKKESKEEDSKKGSSKKVGKKVRRNSQAKKG